MADQTDSDSTAFEELFQDDFSELAEVAADTVEFPEEVINSATSAARMILESQEQMVGRAAKVAFEPMVTASLAAAATSNLSIAAAIPEQHFEDWGFDPEDFDIDYQPPEISLAEEFPELDSPAPRIKELDADTVSRPVESAPVIDVSEKVDSPDITSSQPDQEDLIETREELYSEMANLGLIIECEGCDRRALSENSHVFTTNDRGETLCGSCRNTGRSYQ